MPRTNGHRYTVEITLVGKVIEAEGNSDNGMIMDFSDVKTLAKQHLVDVWDHAFIVYEKDTPVREFLAITTLTAGSAAAACSCATRASSVPPKRW